MDNRNSAEEIEAERENLRRLYLAIGRFIFEFSQLEFMIRHLLGEALRLRDGVLVFTREACPNCPPVANYVVASGMKAVFVDVDGDEGLALARDLGVMATPTVLALDCEGRESFRAFDLNGLRSRLEIASPAGAR